MTFPKIHEREMITRESGINFSKMVLTFKEENNITDAEYLQLLNSEVASTLKYMLRFERHGDYETPSGLQK